MEVTFEIKLYDNDWKYILLGDYLERLIENCNFNFKQKHLIINNVSDLPKVLLFANKKLRKGTIDKIIIVEEVKEEVLSFYGLSKESFNGGYNYSIAELTGIYFCETEFLLHFSSDSFLKPNKSNWIQDSLHILKSNNEFIVVNPVWNNSCLEVKNEAINNIGDYSISYGFSDQCYLIKNNVFKRDIYKFKHPESERYPKYGGELFEKRVDSFMRVNEKYRLTYNKLSYWHINFPKNKFLYKFYFYIMYITNSRLNS